MTQKLYEDKIGVALLAEKAVAKGHVIIRPKRAVNHLSDLSKDESSHLFLIASYTAAILFQGLKAEGTNILCCEEDGLSLHVLPRRSNDGLSFQWNPKKIDEDVMNDSLERITDKTFYIGKSGTKDNDRNVDESDVTSGSKNRNKEQERLEQDQMVEDYSDKRIKDEEERENYLIKQLIRVP